MTKSYAGIGSRETPEDIMDIMTGFAILAESKGWILRSGGAEGADTAFERGIKLNQNKEIYLPWGRFNGNPSQRTKPLDKAFEYAEAVFPYNWNMLSQGAKKLHARNIHQILGDHLTDPVKFVICWTKNGKVTGGTGQALRLAEELNIPIFNLGGTVDEDALETILLS